MNAQDRAKRGGTAEQGPSSVWLGRPASGAPQPGEATVARKPELDPLIGEARAEFRSARAAGDGLAP